MYQMKGVCPLHLIKKRRRQRVRGRETVLLQPISKCNSDISYFRAEGKPEGWRQREATENDREKDMKVRELDQ